MMIVSDARRYGGDWWKAAGFYASLAYRVRRARKTGTGLCRWLLPVNIMTSLLRHVTSDAELPWSSPIGPGLALPHPQGVILGGRVRIGPVVTLFQQVTLGGWMGKQPIVRSHAALYAGAKAFGGVTIGRYASVGANAVVLKDVPDYHTAVGVPAKNRPSRHVRPPGVRAAGLADE